VLVKTNIRGGPQRSIGPGGGTHSGYFGVNQILKYWIRYSTENTSSQTADSHTKVLVCHSLRV